MAYAKILEQQFDLIDKNHDRKLNQEEIEKLLVAFGFREQDAKGFLKKFDSNKDGWISRDEFLNAVDKEKSNKFPEAQLRALFLEADEDNSVKITAEELKQFSDGYHNLVTPKEVDKCVDEYDKYVDDKLDYEEFLTLLKKLM